MIGTLNEGAIHAGLKAHYARPGDTFEVPLEGFVIDVRRADLLIEIQTGSFGAMGSKLDRLLDVHRMLLVHPIAVEVYLERPGTTEKKSRTRGTVYDVFDELVSVPTLLDHPNLELEVALIAVTHVQEVRRQRFRTVERKLRAVRETRRFRGTHDLAALLPAELPPQFTTADLAKAAKITRDVAQKMAFCLRALDVLHEVTRTRAGIVYVR